MYQASLHVVEISFSAFHVRMWAFHVMQTFYYSACNFRKRRTTRLMESYIFHVPYRSTTHLDGMVIEMQTSSIAVHHAVKPTIRI